MHAPGPLVVAAIALAALPLTACQSGVDAASQVPAAATSTVTVIPGSTPPLSTDAPTAAHEWAGGSDGTGMFEIGTHSRDGSAATIPPGRYQVRLSPGAKTGGWMLCESSLCGPAFQENATVVGRPIGDAASVMYIGPKAQALWLSNVVLSPALD